MYARRVITICPSICTSNGSQILWTRSRFCRLPLHVQYSILLLLLLLYSTVHATCSTRQHKTGQDRPRPKTCQCTLHAFTLWLKLVHAFAMPRLGMGRSAEPVTVVAAPACIRQRELASLCLRVMLGSTCPALSAATPCRLP